MDKIAVGAKGSYRVGSDTYPVTCVEVLRGGRQLVIRFEEFVADVGHDYFGSQKWKIFENPHGRMCRVNWAPKRNVFQDSSAYVTFNGWKAYQDPSF